MTTLSPNGAKITDVADVDAALDLLVDLARRGVTVTYGDLLDAIGKPRTWTGYAGRLLGQVGWLSVDVGLPPLTALVVNATTRECGSGFLGEFGRDPVDVRRAIAARAAVGLPLDPRG